MYLRLARKIRKCEKDIVWFEIAIDSKEGKKNVEEQTNALPLQTHISIKNYRTQKYLHESKPR